MPSNNMTIGLLQCDHVAESYLHFGGDYDQMFSVLLPGFDWVYYDVVNSQFPTSVHDCDAYLCTGSKYSVYDDLPWIQQLKEFMQELYQHHKPFIGVCFGHQMLAQALGGSVGKAALGWCVGVHAFHVLHYEAWMEPARAHFNLLMSCQDQVQQLPPDSVVLAETADCPVGIFRVGDRMLGIQAHPEFSKAYARALMEGRRERMGEKKVEVGSESLDRKLDEKMMAAWMKCFFRGI